MLFIDLPKMWKELGVIYSAVHCPNDDGEYLMFSKLDLVTATVFLDICLSHVVETVCKLAVTEEEEHNRTNTNQRS